MWIWIIIIAAVVGGLMGFFGSDGDGSEATGGAMAGGCLAASCLGRLALTALGIILVLWLFSAIFG